MTNAELDTLWSRAEQFSGGFTRYRFAALVAAAEREACAQMVDHILREGGGTYGDAIRARGQPDHPKVTHLNEWARDRLARHGINPCPDCHGVGYDASGQRCWCQQNPSF
jgi:hypothetical protein